MTELDDYAKKLKPTNGKKRICGTDIKKIHKLLNLESEEKGIPLCDVINEKGLGNFLKDPRK